MTRSTLQNPTRMQLIGGLLLAVFLSPMASNDALAGDHKRAIEAPPAESAGCSCGPCATNPALVGLEACEHLPPPVPFQLTFEEEIIPIVAHIP